MKRGHIYPTDDLLAPRGLRLMERSFGSKFCPHWT